MTRPKSSSDAAVTLICPQCKNEFTRFRSHAAKERYCSLDCAAIGRFGDRPELPNPSGICLCGCGQTTPISPKTHRKKGYVAGEHVKYCKGHAAVKYVGPKWIVDPETECWNWQRGTTSDGYPTDHTGLVHRSMYIAKFGEIPNDFHVHHRCENIVCVNPDHGFPVSPGDHQRIHAMLRRGDITLHHISPSV